MTLGVIAVSDPDMLVIRDEDLAALPQEIVIREEDLPPLPFLGSVPSDLITIDLGPDDLYDMARRMLDLVNADRALHQDEAPGARPLIWRDDAADVALAHSEDMRSRLFFDHTNPDGLKPHERLRKAGVPCVASGENIAGTPTMLRSVGDPPVTRMYTGYPTIEAAEEGLMNSPGHRRNILNPKFTHCGIGIARNADGTLIITQNFVAFRW